MNIGIFSGSFDPIHIGHIILANYIVEFTEIDKIWFLVSPQSPFKADKELTDENQRLEMVQQALADYEHFEASNIEFSLPKPSYTVNTLEAVQEKYPEHQFTLIIGADNWASFEDWKNPERILDRFKLMVYPRLGSRITIPTKMRNKVEALESPIIEISSTFIREGIAEGRDMKAFLPLSVYNIINEKQLYK